MVPPSKIYQWFIQFFGASINTAAAPMVMVSARMSGI